VPRTSFTRVRLRPFARRGTGGSYMLVYTISAAPGVLRLRSDYQGSFRRWLAYNSFSYNGPDCLDTRKMQESAYRHELIHLCCWHSFKGKDSVLPSSDSNRRLAYGHSYVAFAWWCGEGEREWERVRGGERERERVEKGRITGRTKTYILLDSRQ
jgi:hypothetical protein